MAEPRTPGPLTAALDKVLHLSMLVAADLARFEKDSGLTTPRVHLLWTLGETGPTTQRALATALDVTPRNVTGLIDGLVASGHVTREPHPTDRRATLVTPTELGAKTIHELRASHDDLARQLFEAVPPQRLSSFVTTLDETIAIFARLMEEGASSPRRLAGAVRDAVLLELALYRSLARWVMRRPDVPAGSTPIGYAQLVGPMLWLWIFGSATEAVVAEVVLRKIDAGWAEAIRLPVLVLGIWGVLWMLGMLASYRVRPHLLTEDRLRVRNGARTWADVPLEAVTRTQSVEHELPGVIKAIHLEGTLLLVGVSSRTNLELVLAGPTVVRTSKGEMTADRVGLWVDDPRAVAAQLRQRTRAAN